jgi:hypothetical protein
MLRTIGLAGVTLTLALAASPAAAQTRCTAPDEPGWHSCLTASHRLAEDGGAIHLTKVRPRLVIRYEEACPDGADRRTVVIRTGDGRRIGRTIVRSRCKRGVARYDATLRLDVELPEGTVVRSFWSGIPDGATAPKVKLTD